MSTIKKDSLWTLKPHRTVLINNKTTKQNNTTYSFAISTGFLPHVGRRLQDQADYGGVALVSRQVQGRVQIGVQQVEQRDHLELLQKVLHNVDIAPGAGHMKERLSVAVLGEQELLQAGAVLQRVVDELHDLDVVGQVQDGVLVLVLGDEEARTLAVVVVKQVPVRF